MSETKPQHADQFVAEIESKRGGKICKNCHWWDTNEEVIGTGMQIPATCLVGEERYVHGGICHRYALREKGVQLTREDFWCGDFVRR